MVNMPHWPLPIWHNNINYELSKIYQLLKTLGNPHLKLPPVIHITGTNGKGSTLAFCRAILEEQGLKVHCYTSPHLLRFNERIVVANSEINDSLIYEYLERTRIAAESSNIEVTFFEGVTAAAFLAFSEIKADIALIEVGMGGRLDATNVVIPELTVITPVSLDHTIYLGEKLYQIALEKAGIMKKNASCVISLQTDEAFNIFELKAKELEVNLIAYEYDYVIEKTKDGFIFKSNQKTLSLPKPNLIGDHQYINASTAIAAVINLKSFNISDEAIIRGITSTKWLARLQQITRGRLFNLLSKNEEIWIDGAHNEAGAQVLSLWIDQQIDQDIYLIVGITKGRDIEAFLRYFLGKVKLVVGILVESEASSYKAVQISDAAKIMGFDTIAAASIEDAIVIIQNYSKHQKSKIIFCGSLYLAGDALSFNL
jgi:dihydrofolate synthase/folylpolyglutamate synthase